MSRNLSILHIASFTGNVGDYVNHMGTSVLFNEYFHDLDITITRKEIREMYWGLSSTVLTDFSG